MVLDIGPDSHEREALKSFLNQPETTLLLSDDGRIKAVPSSTQTPAWWPWNQPASLESEVLDRLKVILVHMDVELGSDLNPKDAKQPLHDLQSLVSRIKTCVYNRKEFEYWSHTALTIEEEEDLNTWRKLLQVWSTAYETLSELTGHWSSHIVKLIKDYCVDGDHPWKSQKYQYVLEGMQLFLNRSAAESEALNKELERITSADPASLKSFEVPLKEALSLLGTAADAPHKRTRHLEFMGKFRDALDLYFAEKGRDGGLPKELEGSRAVLHALCRARFSGVHLHAFGKKVVPFILREGAKQLHSDSQNLSDDELLTTLPMKEQFDMITAAPQEIKAAKAAIMKGKLMGHFGISFDPHLAGNTPFVLYDLQCQTPDGKEKNITAMRFGTPTVQDAKGNAEVIPEFRGMLDAYESTGRKHLIINLQNIEKKAQAQGDESVRWEAQRKCAEEEFPKSAYAVTLGQDSDLAHQSGKYAGEPILQGKTISTSYAEAMKADILNCREGYYFPKEATDDPQFHETISAIIDSVHNLMLPEGVPEDTPVALSRDERIVFKEMVDAFIVHYLITSRVVPDSFHIACKDAIDRGGKNAAIFLKVLSILLEKEEQMEPSYRVFAHLPALLVKKQAVIKKRAEYLALADKFLNSPEKKKAIRRLGEKFAQRWDKPLTIQGIAITDEPSQIQNKLVEDTELTAPDLSDAAEFSDLSDGEWVNISPRE